MTRIKERALALRRFYGIRFTPTDDQIAAIEADLGLEVGDAPLRHLPQIYVNGRVRQRRQDGQGSKRWLRMLAIGHRHLHVGNQLTMAPVLKARQDREAEDFAGWLLFGPLPKSYRGELPATVRALAEWGEVPEEVVWPWWARAAPIGSGLRYA